MFGRRRVTVAEKQLPPEVEDLLVPEPMDLTAFAEATTIESYLELAGKIGFSNGSTLRLQLVECLRTNGIQVYPFEKVEKYLGELVWRKRESQPGLVWCWKPLRFEDVGALGTEISQTRDGHISRSQYHNAVPIHALQKVETIVSGMPDKSVHFYVSDYEVPHPDPFLAVAGVGFSMIVIDHWDEPDFKL